MSEQSGNSVLVLSLSVPDVNEQVFEMTKSPSGFHAVKQINAFPATNPACKVIEPTALQKMICLRKYVAIYVTGS